MQGLKDRDIVHIDCGEHHIAALDSNGDLYTWGGGKASQNKGQTGHGHNQFVEEPKRVEALASKRVT